MEFRDLKRQYSALGSDIDGALKEVLSSGVFIGGKVVSELESRLAEYVGVRHCISCANGTDALSIALKIWGIGPGDAVFVPDFTFFSTAETVASEGAVPVFVDVDASTFNMSADDLQIKIEAVKKEGMLNPKAVIPVDLFGQPADYAKILPLASKYGLYVLEDGAQGFGGAIASGNVKPRMNCSFGDIATTSFFPAKPLGCYGDGGAIFTDSDDWAALASSIKVHGRGEFKYDNVRLGLNSRLDAVQAAILLVKFKAFRDSELDAVNRVASWYAGVLPCDVIIPTVPAGYRSSWAQYTIRLADRGQRDGLQAFLKERGIPSMIYYPKGMSGQTAFRECPSYGHCPVSRKLCDTVLSLPMHPYMTEAEAAEVAAAVKEYLH